MSKPTAPALFAILQEAEERAAACVQLLAAAYEEGYEPSAQRSEEPRVSGTRDRPDAPPSGERSARSTFRYAATELAQAATLIRPQGMALDPVALAVRSGSLTPSAAQAGWVAERLAAKLRHARLVLAQDGRVRRDVCRSVYHLDRAVRALSPFREPTGTRPTTHAPGRRRRDLERAAR